MEGAHWLISACLMTSSVIAFGANSFLLIIFCRRRGLRTVPNRFVINLLIVNLLSSLLLLPLLFIDQQPTTSTLLNQITTTNRTKLELSSQLIIEEITNSSKIEIIETVERLSSTSVTHLLHHHQENTSSSETLPLPKSSLLCCLNQTVTSLVSTLSILSILLIGINQYFGVMHSLRYHFYINKCRSTCSIVGTWIVAGLCAVLSGITSDSSKQCSYLHHLQRRKEEEVVFPILSTLYALTYFLFVILAPFAAICAIYVCIYRAAHKNSERMRNSTSANLIKIDRNAGRVLQKVQSAPNFAYLNCGGISGKEERMRAKVTRTCSERVATATSSNFKFIASLKSKISHASLVFRCREETRAAKISFFVIVLVLVCYVPYGVGVVAASEMVGVRLPQVFNAMTLVLLGVANAVTPFLFAYRNRRVKREIGKVLGVVSRVEAAGGSAVVVEKRRRMSTNDVVMMSAACVQFLDEDEDEDDEEVEGRGGVPEVVVTCSNERKSILKRVCGGSNWVGYKKCNFIAVPESCCSGEARGSFSSASTQISNED